MRYYKLITDKYKHDYFFEFNGEKYKTHSIVKLSEYGKLYLGAFKNEAILKEQFLFCDKKLCWKYEFMSSALNEGITNISTDEPPEKMIDDIIFPADEKYVLLEEFGVHSQHSDTVIKETKKDYEIPELRSGWIKFILFFLCVIIFKDWYVRLILRIIACIVFGMYREKYINAYTIYKNPENYDMLKNKYKVLYGIKEHGDNE